MQWVASVEVCLVHSEGKERKGRGFFVGGGCGWTSGVRFPITLLVCDSVHVCIYTPLLSVVICLLVQTELYCKQLA